MDIKVEKEESIFIACPIQDREKVLDIFLLQHLAKTLFLEQNLSLSVLIFTPNLKTGLKETHTGLLL